MVDKCKKIDADEAIKRKGVFGKSDKELLDIIKEKQGVDDKFTDIRSIRFGWVKQPQDSSGKSVSKLMSTLPNGKYIFPDKSENLENIVPEEPYLCLVFEPEGEKVAFAKILFPEYKPKIYIPPSRIPAMVWRDSKGIVRRKMPIGTTYEERLISAIKEMESLGVESVTVVFRKNMRD